MNNVNYYKKMEEQIGEIMGEEKKKKLLLHCCCAPAPVIVWKF